MKRRKVLSIEYKARLKDIFGTSYFPTPYSKYFSQFFEAVENKDQDISKAFFTDIRDAVYEMRKADKVIIDIADCALSENVQYLLFRLSKKYSLIDSEDSVRDKYVRLKDTLCIEEKTEGLKFPKGTEDDLINYIKSLRTDVVYTSNGTSEKLIALLLLVRPEIKVDCSLRPVLSYIKSIYYKNYGKYKKWYYSFQETLAEIEESPNGTYELPGDDSVITRTTFLDKYNQVPIDYLDKGVDCEEVLEEFSRIIFDALNESTRRVVTFLNYGGSKC